MGINEKDPVEPGTLTPHSGPLVFEPEKYIEHADGLSLTDQQKIEFLRALWDIMSAFVELGFGVDSVLPILAQRASESGADALQETIPTHEFNVAADDGGQEGK